MRGMTLQPICYRGRTVAAATRTRFFLAEALDERPADDPERTFVIFMCAYAGDVLAGVLPGPYSDEDARRYARLPGAGGAARALRARRRAGGTRAAAARVRAGSGTR